jgi:hypothetical protein
MSLNIRNRHVHGGAADAIQNRRSHHVAAFAVACYLFFQCRTDREQDDS